MALYRTCRRCGTDYKISRPACPACGATPLGRRAAWAFAGPRMLALSGFLFFLVWAAYSLALSPDGYARYRHYFFGLPHTLSRVVGVAGAAVFLGIAAFAFFRWRPGGRGGPPEKKPADGPGGAADA